MQATLGTIFEQDPPERRQEGRRQLGAHDREILTERQLQHFVHIRAGLRGEDALVQRLWGHGRLRMALPEQITEPVQRYRASSSMSVVMSSTKAVPVNLLVDRWTKPV